MPRLLSLFDGTGAISRPFIEAGWEVQSLDIDGSHGATLTTDILKWDYQSEPPCDVVFAGCPCEAYSQANTRGKRNLVLADSLVQKTWEIIQHFQQLNPELLFFVASRLLSSMAAQGGWALRALCAFGLLSVWEAIQEAH